MALVLTCEVFASEYVDEPEIESYGDEELAEIIPYVENDKYIRHIHSMINAYRDDVLDRRMVIETNSLVDTKYKTWKRNGDLINSLLALPKGMNDAGR
ncbi:hypothetical protein PYW08_003777 [Mythimna loreyi]|uniref:Uncharacterized protein n=1 Tax=Mythimna loreyi TaxID=667449 RepID=A0ACC2QU69_9NEOP|nr:hypothetical protein PYW08_003777 [Mythimna loreyi]